MLKLYTNSNFLKAEYRKHIFPLLLDLHFLKQEKLLNYYTLVNSIKKADIVVVPIEYQQAIKYPVQLQKLYELALNNNKPIWVYTGGDFGYTINKPNVFNFRLGGFHTKLNKKTIIVPSLIQDPYLEYLKTKFTPLKKEEKPTIGFVGHAKGGVTKYIKEFIVYLKTNTVRILKKIKIDYQTFYPSSIKRAKYLKILKNDVNIKDNFILRNQYRAGVKTKEEREKTTQEFYDNIVNNLYTFCIRGAGNFSVRFYETLAVGRIPVLLDTDCLLPLSNSIDWEKHCVIIKNGNTNAIVKQLLNFHACKSEKELEQIQKSNRELWNNYLKRDTFFIAVHQNFKAKNKITNNEF